MKKFFVSILSAFLLLTSVVGVSAETVVRVKKNTETTETTKVIRINYYDFENNEQVDEVPMTVPSTDTHVNTSELTAPQGYELVESGDLPIRDGYVYVEVRPVETTKEIRINYYDFTQKEQIAEVAMNVAKDATYVNTSKLVAPQGYELVETGDLPIRDGYVFAEVRKLTTKEIKLNFYDEVAEKQVEERTVEVAYNATYVNTTAYDAPEGYEVVLLGDLPIRDGYVYVAVRPVETSKEIRINFYDEEQERQVAEVAMNVAKDATYVNTSKLVAPEGYELVLAGDLPIRDGYVYAQVRRVAMVEVKLNFYDEDAEKQVEERTIEVAYNATSVNTTTFKAPKGYEVVLLGDLPIRDGYVYVAVRKVVTPVQPTNPSKPNISCAGSKDKNCDGVVTCEETMGNGWAWNNSKKVCEFAGSYTVVNTSAK